LESFALNIIADNALAELTGVMITIDVAPSKNWSNLWLESDSKLVNFSVQEIFHGPLED
jgi:ribonuclease HI